MRPLRPEGPPDAGVRRALHQFLAELRACSRGRLHQVVLFGSQARGDARPGSDVDLLIVWDGSVHEALHLMAPLSLRVFRETGVDIAPHPIQPGRLRELRAMRTAFVESVEQEGLVVEG